MSVRLRPVAKGTVGGPQVLAAVELARACGALVVVASLLGTTAPGLASDGYRPLHIGGAGVRWPRPAVSPGDQSVGSGRTVLTYAVAEGEIESAGAINCSRITAPHRIAAALGLGMGEVEDLIADAFARWQRVANIAFVRAAPGTAADIVIGEQSEPTGIAFTNVVLGAGWTDGRRHIARSQICLNPERRWKIGFDGDLTSYDVGYALTHEIGHAIGLDHPSPRGHLMSFRYDERVAELSTGDVQGAIALYGRARGDATVAVTPEPRAPATQLPQRIITRSLKPD